MRLISSAGMNLSRFPLIANLDVSVSNKHSWLDGPIAGAEGSVAGHPFTRARKNKYTTRPNETGIRNATPLKNCPSTNCDPLLKNVHQVRTGGRARSHCIQDIIQPSEKNWDVGSVAIAIQRCWVYASSFSCRCQRVKINTRRGDESLFGLDTVIRAISLLVLAFFLDWLVYIYVYRSLQVFLHRLLYSTSVLRKGIHRTKEEKVVVV